MKTLLLLLLSTNAFAQYSYDVPEDEVSPSTEEVLIKRPEKYLRRESMIYDFNTDLGIKDQRKYTGEDRNRFSVTGSVSGDYEHFSDVLGIDIAYLRRSERFHQAWYGAQFFRHKSYFDNLTQNPSGSTGNNPGSDAANPRPNNQDASVTGLGLGGGYRFKLLLDFIETDDMFENIDVFANYITMNETFLKKSYTGWGLSTNYGIHKRANSSYYYGGKLSYNLASVTREPIGTESKDDRTLALGWLTIGFEMGFFY